MRGGEGGKSFIFLPRLNKKKPPNEGLKKRGELYIPPLKIGDL